MFSSHSVMCFTTFYFLDKGNCVSFLFCSLTSLEVLGSLSDKVQLHHLFSNKFCHIFIHIHLGLVGRGNNMFLKGNQLILWFMLDIKNKKKNFLHCHFSPVAEYMHGCGDTDSASQGFLLQWVVGFSPWKDVLIGCCSKSVPSKNANIWQRFN